MYTLLTDRPRHAAIVRRGRQTALRCTADATADALEGALYRTADFFRHCAREFARAAGDRRDSYRRQRKGWMFGWMG